MSELTKEFEEQIKLFINANKYMTKEETLTYLNLEIRKIFGGN